MREWEGEGTESSGTLRGPIRGETVGLERPMSRWREFYGRWRRNSQHSIRSKTPCSTVVRRICKEEVKVRRERDDIKTAESLETNGVEPTRVTPLNLFDDPSRLTARNTSATLIHGAVRDVTRWLGFALRVPSGSVFLCTLRRTR